MVKGERNAKNQGWLKVLGNTRPISLFLKSYALLILFYDVTYFIYYLVTSIFSALYGILCPPKMKSLRGEVAVVVGASRGLGREVVMQLVAMGAVPICLDKNHVDNKALVKSIREQGKEAYGYTCDVTDKEQIKRTMDFIDRQVGDITMYFHCCGVPSPRSLVVSEPPTLHETMNISIVSHFYLLDEILPKLKKIEHGHIVLLTSVAGLSGMKAHMPLAVSQFAVQGLYESLVEDIRMSKLQSKIHISLVHIYPFVVSESLENDIRLRIPSYFGTMRADKAANAILNGVRRNQMEMSVPKYYLFIGNFLRMFPKQATFLLRELLDTGVDFG